jgi:hypothetical protein
MAPVKNMKTTLRRIIHIQTINRLEDIIEDISTNRSYDNNR